MASIPYDKRKFDKAKKQAYDTEDKKAHFDQIHFMVPKGTKDLIKDKASKEGMTMAEWLKMVVDNAL